MYSSFYSNLNSSFLPAQMIPLSKKDEEWKKRCMDSLEQEGRTHIIYNRNLVENYEMVKGHLITSHYYDVEEGYADMIQKLTKEFELPNYLRSYDIISPVINTLSAERLKRPDTFRVKDKSEKGTNEFRSKRNELISSYVQQKIEDKINEKLVEMGIDPAQQDFASEEEAQAQQQAIAQVSQAMTPPEIEQYMKTDFMSAAEQWGQHQLEDDKERFRLEEKEKKEFEDMLVSDRCFRHFYLTGNGYNQETWNPVNTFFHKSPDVDYVEDGDYVGRIFYLTTSDIIDRYGYLMTKEELDSLEVNKERPDKRWNEAPGTEYVYDRYAVPFKDYPTYDVLRKTVPGFGVQAELQGAIPFISHTELNSWSNSGLYGMKNGYYPVTEAYWKSQKKIGLVTYIDEETGILTKKLVDENFLVPEYFTVIESTILEEQPVNTVVWTWINEVWRGIKINISWDNNRREDIYLSIKPNEFQFKGDLNPYGAKLPVCGQIFSVRNSRSMSLVDLMKPYQIGFNVAMNQTYQLMEKEIGAFIVMDVNMFPNSKDWGGEDSWEKWMLIAKNLGMLPADTSPANTAGAVAMAGGQYPKVINLDLAAQMMSRMSLASTFKQFALEQVGFNQYRTGNFSSESTATGINQGQQQSYAQTESLFTMFSNYQRRCYRMDLDIAQFVQAKKEDITISYTKNDLSNGFISVAGTDLLLSDLHIFIVNSQEQIRQLEMMRDFALSNNTAGATPLDVMDIITMNSTSEIKQKLAISFERQQQMQERQMQIQEEGAKIQTELEALRQQKEDERLDKELENERYIAELNADTKRSTSISPDTSSLDSEKLSLQQQQVNNKAAQDSQKNQQQLQSQIRDSEFKLKKLALEDKKINSQLQIQKDELEFAKIMKGKESKRKD